MTDDEQKILTSRARIGEQFVHGSGVEVGAGSRPFPVPPTATVFYGDVRDRAGLEKYFGTAAIPDGAIINAQTFAGIEDGVFDFVISAHVIEHLRDPIGAIVQAMRVLKSGGTFVLVAPDRTKTWDHRRPNTTVEHSLLDYGDGGESTTRQGYWEHLTYVHPVLTGQTLPPAEIERQAAEAARRWQELDVHFHAWDRPAFEAMLEAASRLSPFRIVFADSIVNENQFVLAKA